MGNCCGGGRSDKVHQEERKRLLDQSKANSIRKGSQNYKVGPGGLPPSSSIAISDKYAMGSGTHLGSVHSPSHEDKEHLRRIVSQAARNFIDVSESPTAAGETSSQFSENRSEFYRNEVSRQTVPSQGSSSFFDLPKPSITNTNTTGDDIHGSIKSVLTAPPNESEQDIDRACDVVSDAVHHLHVRDVGESVVVRFGASWE
eukprot:TRINITY_DN9105_c0_g1_i1.p1 TRINITY_DN9105_c0_g1~~TRINITY_DN9105_c0_g1_i1.p1  ORF type:complete len:201 (-),score=16.64 TRINITY_DN9105_c0_g1_i1:113-715(-)